MHFYQVNNLFLHQSYLKSPKPTPSQINLIKNAKNHFLLLSTQLWKAHCPFITQASIVLRDSLHCTLYKYILWHHLTFGTKRSSQKFRKNCHNYKIHRRESSRLSVKQAIAEIFQELIYEQSSTLPHLPSTSYLLAY